jgi:hypothetical protein
MSHLASSVLVCLLLLATTANAEKKYEVRLWSPGTQLLGGPDCRSPPADTFLGTFTAALNTCFGNIGLGDGRGAVVSTVSYKLVPGSSSGYVLLNVYGGSTCATAPFGLGEVSPGFGNSLCQRAGFNYPGSTPPLRYEQSWTIKDAPESGDMPPPPTGVIVGVVVGVVVLGGLAYLYHRQRVASGAPSPFGGGGIVIMSSNPTQPCVTGVPVTEISDPMLPLTAA